MTPRLPGMRVLKAVTPPAAWTLVRAAWNRVARADSLMYAPLGWATALPPLAEQASEWDAYLRRDRLECAELQRQLQAGESVRAPNAAGQLNYMNYAYALAAVAAGRRSIRVLDYGGALGDYYWATRLLLPEIAVEYHCKELPVVAAVGQTVSPAVIWHTDDACLDQPYDLVMFCGSLQYIPAWRALLHRAALAAPHVFISLVPTVAQVPGYVMTQRERGRTVLYQSLNRADLLAAMRATGFHVVNEFRPSEHPVVMNAPEPPAFGGWLFARDHGPR